MRYASEHGIDPSLVESATLVAFEHWSNSATLRRDAGKLAYRSVRAWNQAVDSVAEWPRQRLVRSVVRDRYALPLDAYLEAFQQDVARFRARIEQTDADEIFSDDIFNLDPAASSAPPRAARPLTIEHRVFQIRQAAGALVRSGVPIVKSLAIMTP